MRSSFLEYFRCPNPQVDFQLSDMPADRPGHFRWGPDTICYGKCSVGSHSERPDGNLYDVSPDISIDGARVGLPFDPDEVIQNFQRERYAAHFRDPGRAWNALIRHIYYVLRPYLSVPIRKRLQWIKLRKWRDIPFPGWPVDCTVDRIQRQTMALAMKAAGVDTMPFIWFWPEGHLSAAIITHDVETTRGRDFCGELMDIDDAFGFKASFQLVPEERYVVSQEHIDWISDRGHEVNVHDLNHDGRLYVERQEFIRRAGKINEYVKTFRAKGFRSGIMYRNADWFSEFKFSYDMSIPNVGHLDPQRGGCCTVLPYFVGDIVELPLTCTQDYTLFHVLNDFSLNIWWQQIGIVMANHGLITVLVHPDYLMESRAQNSYKSLLQYLAELRDTGGLWGALPREVAEWWRQRSQMEIVRKGENWEIVGEGAERAHIAYAKLSGDSVVYSLHASDRSRSSSEFPAFTGGA